MASLVATPKMVQELRVRVERLFSSPSRSACLQICRPLHSRQLYRPTRNTTLLFLLTITISITANYHSKIFTNSIFFTFHVCTVFAVCGSTSCLFKYWSLFRSPSFFTSILTSLYPPQNYDSQPFLIQYATSHNRSIPSSVRPVRHRPTYSTPRCRSSSSSLDYSNQYPCSTCCNFAQTSEHSKDRTLFARLLAYTQGGLVR